MAYTVKKTITVGMLLDCKKKSPTVGRELALATSASTKGTKVKTNITINTEVDSSMGLFYHNLSGK